MKQSNSRWAVNLTALVLAAWLLIGLFTGCPNGSGPNGSNESSQPKKLTITVKGDANVIVNEPKTIEVTNGSKWSEVKAKVEEKISYKTNYEAAGFKLDSESGSYLYDNYFFYANKTVFAVSKKIPQPTDPSIFRTDGNGVITDYTCDKEDLPKALVIPAKIGNEVITGIRDNAFYGCKGLTSLDLSACTSLTVIGVEAKLVSSRGAFGGCTGLTEVKLPASLTQIDNRAFSGCMGLTSIDLSGCTNLTEIGERAFEGCTGLTEVKLPANLTEIGESTFEGYTGLTEVKLPASLTEIGERTFEGCTGLTSIDLSVCTSLTEIDFYAFKGCKGLTEVKLPANLTTIHYAAFEGCTGLTNIDLSACTSLTNISGFSGCTGLTSIDLSACTSLTEIEIYAFKGCKGLTEVKLPANLTKIGGEAFTNCSKLTGTIVFPANLKTIKSYTNSTYPYSIVGAFEGCTKLQGADFSACTNFTKIENSTFKNCTSLTEVKLPASLTEIGERAFTNCFKLTGTIVFPASLKTIKSYRESSYPYDFVGAFQYCTKLQGADFSACANFTKIENSTFKNCEGLTEVKLPASLTEIEKEAFKDCVNLTSAVFADKNRWEAGSTPIDPSDLDNAATAARYLRETYVDEYWKKN